MRTRRMRGLALAGIVALAVGVGAGCGGDDDAAETPGGATTAMNSAPQTTPPPATSTGGETTAPADGGVTVVDADPDGKLEFVQKTLTLTAGEHTFELTNASPVPHNLAIRGNGAEAGPTDDIVNGETTDPLVVDLTPGEYEYYCEVPGHEAAGMKGTLTVT